MLNNQIIKPIKLYQNMLYLSTNQKLLKQIWRSALSLLLLIILNNGYVKAQLSSYYNFAQSSGTYAPLSNARTVVFNSSSASTDDVTSGSIALPSNFNFNGTSYSNIYVNTNGFITFGTTAPAGSTYNCISGTTAYGGAIACFNNDMQGSTYSGAVCELSYETVVNEFIVQFQDWGKYGNTAATRFNCQVRLNLCNNEIKIVYGNNFVTNTTYAMIVGLRGSANTNFLNRLNNTVSPTWANTITGTANTSSVNWTSTSSPASGLTFTYTPTSGAAYTVNSIAYNSASVVAVAPGNTNKEILRLDIDVSGSTGSAKVLDTVWVTSNNTADADISSVKLYYSLYPTFSTSTATQLGSSTTFSSGVAKFNTLAKTLACAVNYIYVVYNISSSATVTDYADAKISTNDIRISGATYPASVKSPAGSRQILTPISYVSSTTTQNNGLWVEKGQTDREIIGLQIQMSATGASINIDSLVFNTSGTNGTNNATTNIQNAKVWYTGNSNTFATTTQYGTTVAAPSGQMNFLSSMSLSTGTNYFWLTYEIKATANTNDSVDAKIVRAVVAGTAQTPSITNPTGYRVVRPAYCAINNSFNTATYSTAGIVNISYGTINNTTSAAGGAVPGYNNYQTIQTNAQRSSSMPLNITLGSYTGSTIIGICVWIDFNQNGVFTDAGEQLVIPATTAGNAVGNTTSTYNLNIPCTATLGLTKLRVMSAYLSSTYWASSCQASGYGETEDYTLNITDSNYSYAASYATQTNLLDVKAGTVNNHIIGIPVVISGCTGSISATSFTLNTNGSTNASSDIDSARVYWTGNSSTFATTTQFGKVGGPNGSFTITGNRSMLSDTNWFWLAYDLNTGATIGNYIDAEVTSVTVGSNSYSPSITAPTGKRTVNTDMSFVSATATQNQLGAVVKNTRYNQVIGIEVVMSAGASVNLTQLKWGTSGCTNAGTDIDTARIYYTGNSSVFATTTLHGTYVLNPNGNQTNNTTRSLLPGTNYFWVAYSVKTGATSNNVIDANFTSLTVDGSPQTPAVTSPSGSRKIIPPYCTQTSLTNYLGYGITNVTVGTINNNTGTPTTTNIVSDYTNISTDLKKGVAQTLSVTGNTNSWMYVSGFIDYNQDGDYVDAGEKLGQVVTTISGATTPYTSTINFVVPCTASVGEARMRVKMEYWYSVANAVQDPCTLFYSGYYAEVEEYTVNIQDSAMNVVGATTMQELSTAVSPNSTNNQIIHVQVVTKGCSGSQTMSSLNMNTTGCTDPNNDIDSVIVYYTGNTNSFATTTRFGATGSVNGSYAVNGSLNLTSDTNNFWVTYSLAPAATLTDYVDGQCASVTVNSTNTNTTISSPSGNRQILSPMSYTSSQFTQTNFSPISQGQTNQVVAGYEIVMSSGTSLNIDSLLMNMSGTTATSNLTNVKCWYTGTSSTFAASTQYGNTITSFSAGNARFGGYLALQAGTNYFWLTCDVSATATVGDSIDAIAVKSVINSTNYTPSVTTVAGKRKIIAVYCASNATSTVDDDLGRFEVFEGTTSLFANGTALPALSNSNSIGTYSDFTSLTGPSLTKLKTYNFQATQINSGTFYACGFAIYGDLNQDGDFADAGEQLYTSPANSNAAGYVFSGNIKIPCSALPGSMRIRLVIIEGTAAPAACGTYTWGETEDYTITVADSAVTYVSSTTIQPNTSFVAQNVANAEIIGVKINMAGCSGGQSVTQLNFNTTGSTAPGTDITSAKVWYTGNSATFAATTQFGTTYSNPNGSFSISGSQSLLGDSNYFWLTYNIPSGASVSDVVDAQCTGITLNTTGYTPTVTNPSGTRTISSPMTYTSSTVTQAILSNVSAGQANAVIMGYQIVMSSGTSINLDSLIFTNTGCTNVGTDVTNAKCWFTGNSSTFATTTQYGTTQTSFTGGEARFAGTLGLLSGTNYFWMTYDVKSTATTGDSLDATGVRARINGTTQNPSVTTIAGKRKIIAAYCASAATSALDDDIGKFEVLLGNTSIFSNTSSISPITSNSAAVGTYNDYTALSPINMTKSLGYTFKMTQIEFGATFYGCGFSIFADLNQNGVFTDAGEQLYVTAATTTAGANPLTGTITIPCSATNGITRMRIILVETTVAPTSCLSYTWGETEDYLINILDSNRTNNGIIVSHPSTLDVSKGSTNNQILQVRVNSAGCSPAQTVSKIAFNTAGTNGTNNVTTNITSAKCYYTAASNVFATTTQFGSTITSPSAGALNFTGSTTLTDSAFFWLVYDIKSTANINDSIDAKLDSITISNIKYTPSGNSPAGYRMINSPLSYSSSSTTMPITTVVYTGLTNQSIIRGKITMSSTGSPTLLDSVYINTNGTNNVTTNISNAKIWYTGSSTTFATTTQFGATVAAPSAAVMLFKGANVSLLPGDNYFFVTYDIKTTANIGDSVTARFDSLRVGGVNKIPSNTSVSTKRRILAAYCASNATSTADDDIGKVEILNGTTSLFSNGNPSPTTSNSAATGTYSDFTNLTGPTLTKLKKYGFKVTKINFAANVYTAGLGIWGDLNQDGDFADAGEQLYMTSNIASTNVAGYVYNDSFAIPCSASNGTVRIRFVLVESVANPTACGTYTWGETEDYNFTVQDSNRSITSIATTTAATTDILKGSSNNQILAVRVNSSGCAGNQTLSQLNFNTTGTTNTGDLTAAKVYYTGNSPVFATTTQFGSTVNNPSGNFSVTGSQAINFDSSFFWLTYNINSSASNGNYVDAEGTVATINSTTYGTSSAPSGNRMINVPMSYTSSTGTQTNTNTIFKGSTNQQILGAQIVMSSGTAQNAKNFEFTVNGTTAVADIANVKLWYTGNSSTFAATTQFGSQVNSPSYNISFNSTQTLLTGTNYFWLTYNVATNATTNDSLDAEFYSFDLDSLGTTNTWYPSNSNPTGKRVIIPPYCTPNNYTTAATYLTGITQVQLGSINNSTSVPNITGGSTHNDYTNLSATLQKSASYSLVINTSGVYTNQYTAAWIDYNADNTFQSNEKLGQVTVTTTTGVVTYSFSVPCNAVTGSTRMRIRHEYYANNGQALDPCNYIYQYGGETEDYTLNIIDSPVTVVSVNTLTASTLDVFASSTNKAVISVPVVVRGCTGSLAITQLNFNTNGSSNASNDIANAKVWYTGNTNTFAATTQFGSTSTSPVGSFSVNGNMALISDTNWFWLSYDIAGSATTNNYVDAECNSVTISTNNYTPSTQAPSGNRMVNVPMTYTSSNTSTSTTMIVEKGTKKNQIIHVAVTMSSGASVNLTQLNLSTNGSTNASTDIDSAKVYFTGNSNVFATTTLFGQYAAPNGSFNLTGSATLLSGTNYFWVVYDIKTGATTSDSVDAECTAITVDGNSQTPSVTAPAGKRRIIPAYCKGTYSNDYHTTMFMTRVKANGIDNTTTYADPSLYYNYYSNQTCSLTVAQNDTFKVQAGGTTYNISVGIFADLNQDGDFDDTGEKLGENQNVLYTGLTNIPVIVPSGALAGMTRLRVRNTYTANSVTPCGTLTYSGETEDYNVYISIPSTPSVVISPSGTASFCQGIGQVFTATPLNANYVYTWKEGSTVKQTGTGTSYATFSYNPAYTGTYSITCSITDQYSQTGVSAATTTTINANSIGGNSAASSNSICSGQTDTLSVSGNAGSPQWQSKVGAGAWTDISGATNSSVIVQPSVTTSYRCKSTLGVCGSAYSSISTIAIGTTSVWTGSYSSAWSYGPNWCSGTVPTSSSNVTIGAGTYQPIIASTVNCNNLTVNSSATLTVNNGGVLNLGGTFTKNGTLTHNSGKIIMSTPQTLPANAYYWLTLNGSGTYTLAGNTTVNSNLTIASGVTVATAGYNLTVKRDVACDGTMNGAGNLVLDNGTLNQTVSGSATLGNVKVNLGSSALAVRFYNSITITGKLDISGGFVVIYNNTTLTVGSTSTSTGDIKFNYSGAQIVSANSATNTLLKVLGNSTAPQITGANITSNASVYMDRPLGMNLGANTAIGGTLTVVNGTVGLNGYDLNIGKTGTTTGNYVPSGASSFLTNTSTSAGYLRFLGSSSASQITNVILGSQYKVELNRGNSASTGISMGNSFTAKNQVIVQNGSIDLNGWVLTLGSSASLYEANIPIFGSTGYIQTTRSLGTLSNSNVAGLGLVMSTSGSMGNTNIVRGHTLQSSGGNPSIKRYYTLAAASATTITSMTYNFYQPEFNGFSSATKLGIAKSTNGGSTWTHVPTFARQMYTTSALCIANNISLTTSATMFTIGDTTAGYAPSVVSIANEVDNSVQNAWPNPFSENLNILFASKEEGNATIRVTDMSGKTVKNLTVKVGQGNNTISISDMKELPAGAYMINIIGNDKVSTMRVVKSNN